MFRKALNNLIASIGHKLPAAKRLRWNHRNSPTAALPAGSVAPLY